MKDNILYEDKEIIVCVKPAGIATQTPVLGQQDMVSMLKNYRVANKEEPYVGLVHRLDQPVEGVILFAKNKDAAAKLSKQVAQREIAKEYYAVVEGSIERKEGSLNHWLLRDGKTNTSKVVAKNTPNAKEAKLDYDVLETVEVDGKSRSLVLVKLHTGRHHQIRVQMAAFGHPIVGDRKYGEANQKGYEPLSLCSRRLNFTHPKTGKMLDFQIVPKGKQFERFSCQL